MLNFLTLSVRPHLEKGGYHVNRFDAYLPDGTYLLTGKELIRPAARMLLELGWDPEVLLTSQMEGAPSPSFVPRTIGTWAGEALYEEDRGGFRVRPWVSMGDYAETLRGSLGKAA